MTTPESRLADESPEPPIPPASSITWGSCALRQPAIASIMQQALLYFEDTRYNLLAWCIMPNHFHCIVQPRPERPLSGILHSWKSFSAKKFNAALNRNGAFWEKESFDHAIRNRTHLERYRFYTENNPVDAGLCRTPEDWPYSSRGCAFVPRVTPLDFHAPEDLPFKPIRSRGDLPHLHKKGCTYFVTVRMADAVR